MMFRKEKTIVLFLFLAGCELIGPQLHKKLTIVKPAKIDEDAQAPMAATDLNKNNEEKSTKVEIFPGSPDANALLKDIQNKNTGKSKVGEYNLNFNDAELSEVVRVVLGDILNTNFNISPKVSGKVNLQTTKPLTKEELIPTLEMLLGLNNAALTFDAGIYSILPSNDALYSSEITSVSRLPNGYQVRIIPVINVAANDLAEIMKPLLPDKALLKVDDNRNIIMVAGTGVDIARALDTVHIFDVDYLKGKSFGLFMPAHVSASQIIKELDQIFNKKSKEEVGSFYKFIEIERLNAVLAITHQASHLKEIESWVLRLDRTNTTAAGGVNVYRVQHVNAVDLADTLNNIFTGQGSGKSKSSVAAGRNSVSMSNKDMGGNAAAVINNAVSAGDRTQHAGSEGRSSTGSGSAPEMPNVRIIPDEDNNALIIMATAQEYSTILNVIKQVDVLPLQVMVDATIVEITLKDDLQYGIEWYLSHKNGGTNAISGGANNGLNISDVTAGVLTGGFSYAFSSGSKDIQALLTATADNKNLNVISSPSLMVLNNHDATIKVGDSVPTRSAVSTNLNAGGGVGSPIQTSSIQMTDTGIILKIKPRVNAGGMVLMDISQSANVAKDSSTGSGAGIDSPTIQKREIVTNIAVQSGETIVLGGLISTNNDFISSGVPFLSTLPVIGPVFGGITRNHDKTELVVLLTPRVVKSRRDAQVVTDEFKRKLTGIYVETNDDEGL